MNKLHLILPVVAGLAAGNAAALEAVAQSPVGGGSALGAANFANDAKITAVKSQTSGLVQSVSQLKEELKHFTECAADGKLWNGSACVEAKGDNGDDGNKGDDGKISLPTCTTSQTLVSYDGRSLVCRDEQASAKLKCIHEHYVPSGRWGSVKECPSGYQITGCGCTDAGCSTDISRSQNGCRVYSGSNRQTGWMICCQ